MYARTKLGTLGSRKVTVWWDSITGGLDELEDVGTPVLQVAPLRPGGGKVVAGGILLKGRLMGSGPQTRYRSIFAGSSIGTRGGGLSVASPRTLFLENWWAVCGVAKAKP